MLAQSKLSLDGWALVLGASSGFGAAASIEFAQAGCHVAGVHLDRHSTLPSAQRVEATIRNMGREAWFSNVNAADEQRRDQVLDSLTRRFAERGQNEKIRILLHSLAFGSLEPFISESGPEDITQKQLDMTCSVMAHSLVSWVQALVRRDLFAKDARVFAMTSTGAYSVWPGYGSISAAKAALEAHVRQLAYELAPKNITVNAICAGVTDTPALRKIPSHEAMIQVALRKNPNRRLTTPADVASALISLSQPNCYWMTGNVINIDGGEAVAG